MLPSFFKVLLKINEKPAVCNQRITLEFKRPHQLHCIADLTKINFDIFDNAAFENNAESISRTCLDKHHKKTSWFKYKLLAYYHNNIDIF